MFAALRQPILPIVQQHAEESTILRNTRSVLVKGPHVKLHELDRMDDRIAAHLDGLAAAGESGWTLCEETLENPGVGKVFSAVVRTIEDNNSKRLGKLIALAEVAPESQRGLLSAFGWVEPRYLKRAINALLVSPNAFFRQVGIAACAMHRVDPGAALNAAVIDADPSLRARSLRAAGQCGRRDLLTVCTDALSDQHEACRFWAAHSAVLLGQRGKAVRVLKELALSASPFRDRALQLALKVIDLSRANELLKALGQEPANIRALIRGAGIVGDPQYVPWLIKQMADLKLTRLAGEAFSLITGLDLAYLDLERKPPENFEPGPNDDPDNDNVAMDEDDSLPWPDPEKVQAWWSAHSQRFTPGTRYFMGEDLTWEHCFKVLKDGYQRQRIAAAQWRCVLRPGTMLFNTAAPAWRQAAELKRLEAQS